VATATPHAPELSQALMEKVAEACRLIAIPSTASTTPDRFDIRASSRTLYATACVTLLLQDIPVHPVRLAPHHGQNVQYSLSWQRAIGRLARVAPFMEEIE
jgi:hypothetical protein